MRKVYDAHEQAYQNLKKRGATSWNEMYSTEEVEEPDHIGKDRQRFIEDVLDKDWALEIGCGTGPLIRWIFRGTGIEISATAVEMAREQSKGLDIDFLKVP